MSWYGLDEGWGDGCFGESLRDEGGEKGSGVDGFFVIF